MDEQKVVQKLIELDEKVETMATQKSIDHLSSFVSKALDDQLVILQRLDQERVFTTERVKRIETELEQVKLQLKLA
ncbi:hypothetical protein KBD18_02395 [Patescibacteria group bacterium]|nr:hypothetical protein [Patescibacteria group bacterium]